MKKRIFVYAFFSLAFLLSCSGEDLSTNGSAARDFLPKVQIPNNRIDMAEATSLVGEAIAFLDKEHPSESKSSRRVNSVSVLYFSDIKSSIMKSGKYDAPDISDTLAYVFNFEDSLGFVIISNDKRIESPLLAFTENGSLVNGETDNPGLDLFLKRLEGYVLESIAKSDKTDGQSTMAVVRKPPYSGPLDTIVRPLVSVKWGQEEPFWLKLITTQCIDGYYVTGCAATAIAQIMSYWKYPTTIGSSTYNWTRLNRYKHKSDFETYPEDSLAQRIEKKFARAEVANLFEQVGAGVKMNYGCKDSDGSGTTAPYILAFLASKGFTLSGNLIDYDFAFVRSFLQAHRLLIAIGCIPTTAKGKKCHSWVIDGLAKGSDNSNFYIHNNWGWNGSSNGYFLNGVFNPGFYNIQDVQVSAVYR